MKQKIGRFLAYVALITVTIFSLFPVLLMLRISLIEPRKFFEVPVNWLAPLTFQHFYTVLSGPFPRFLTNSLVISLITTLTVMILGTVTAFALAKYNLRKKDNLLFFVLSTRMGPPVVFAIPLHLLMVRLGLIDTHLGLVILYTFFNLAFAIWMMYGFFMDTPLEVEEAAMLDGLSDFGIFSRISIPMVTPGLIATSILVFIFTWNEFFYALIMTRTDAKTFPVQIPAFFGAFRIDWGAMFAASLLGILIPLVFGIAVRKYLTRGLTMGAIK